MPESPADLREENRRLRQQLAAAQTTIEELQACTEAVVDGIITIDTDRHILTFNPAAERIFGYEANEVIGCNVHILMPESYHSAHDAYVENYKKTGEKKIIGIGREVEGRRKNGTLFPMYLGVSEFLNQSQRQFVGVVRDLTKANSVEEKATRVGRILDDSVNEIYLFDAKSLHFIEVNRGALRNLGYTIDEMRDLTPIDLKPDYLPDTFKTLIEPLQTGAQNKAEFTTVHRRKDGSHYPVEVHLQLSRLPGSSVFVAVILDITERQRLEAQLLQSQKLDSIGRLAGGIAHDFNNQLGIILFDVELILSSLQDGHAMREDLEKICRVVRRSADLTRQLLLFSRRQPMDMQPVNLNLQVEDLRQMLDRFLGEDIAVELDLEDDLWTIKADAGTIDQVLTNLALNARDAMPQGGRLVIQTLGLEINATYCDRYAQGRPGSFVCLTVKDDGTGMGDDVLDQLFEPFFTTKKTGKGTGLGLAVVYGIVQAHQGWITVESRLGEGTRFDVYFPATAGTPKNTVSATSTPLALYQGGGEHILLVEDEADLRDRMERVLKTHGYSIKAVGMVADAHQCFAAIDGNFDLIISDIVLPDGRGTDLVATLQKQRPEIKAVLCSGYSARGTGTEQLHSTGFPVLLKPVGMQDLLDAVRQSLDAQP